MKIAVLTAMDSEYRQFVSLQQDNDLKDKTIVVKKCGIGKVNAGVNAIDLIRTQSPNLVISTGVAGGCSEDIEIMDVVVACSVCYHDVWCGQPNVLGQIQGEPSEFFAPEEIIDKIKNQQLKNVKFGKTVSGDWFVDSVEKMRKIKTNFPDATAVDMESAAIAQVCNQMNVPFISLRIISDIPLRENNHKQYKDFWANIADNSFNTAKEIIKLV